MGKFSIFLFLFFTSFAGAQNFKFDANWVFSDDNGINFTNPSAPVAFGANTNAIEANASMSDSAGNLLFYLSWNPSVPNYFSIRDANNDVIQNGDSILIHYSITNGGIILPVSNSKWMLFHTVQSSLNNFFDRHLGYTVIERSGNGLIATEKNVITNYAKVEEHIAAVRHANGQDWWVFAHESFQAHNGPTNVFYKYLISNGAVLWSEQFGAGVNHTSNYSGVGEMTFSRKGNFLVDVLGVDLDAEFFGFDRCSGEFTGSQSFLDVATGGGLYGCEFSPDESKLYFTELPDGGTGIASLYQYDLADGNTKTLIWRDSIHSVGQMELAPDGRIYVAINGQTYLGTINNPDMPGMACDFQLNSIPISSPVQYGLPNYPDYNLGATDIYIADAGADTTICLDSAQSVQLGNTSLPGLVYQWSPASTLSNSNVAQPVASPAGDTYYVLTVTDAAGSVSCQSRTDTVLVKVQECTGIAETILSQVTVYPNPATDVLIIENLPAADEEFVLYNTLGQHVISTKLQDAAERIDISWLPDGVYSYRIAGLAGKLQIIR